MGETPGLREEAAIEMGKRACCRASIGAGFGPCDSCRADADAVLAVVAKHLQEAIAELRHSRDDGEALDALLAALKGAR